MTTDGGDFSPQWRAARDAKAQVFHVIDLIDDGHQEEADAYLASLLAAHADVHAEVLQLMAKHYGTSET